MSLSQMSGYLYRFLYPVLSSIPAEFSHELVIKILSLISGALPETDYRREVKMGKVILYNPVGIGAGIDKNAEALEGWFKLGAGFVCVGTATPRPQKGNPSPRIFRLKKEKSIINWLGFNNDGITNILRRIDRAKFRKTVGISIGKNADTPLEDAWQDYQYCCRESAHSSVDYVEINISSPNTEGLTRLQSPAHLKKIINTCYDELAKSRETKGFFVKISPDLSRKEIEQIAKVLNESPIDAVVICNTTRKIAETGHERGGLSGLLLRPIAFAVHSMFRKFLSPDIPVIASGGIMDEVDSFWRRKLGAKAVYLVTGLIYRGPSLIKRILDNWDREMSEIPPPEITYPAFLKLD